jgi:hypothetical protein
MKEGNQCEPPGVSLPAQNAECKVQNAANTTCWGVSPGVIRR